MTQTEIIKAHLETGKPLTTFEAYTLYGITTLGQRCTELRKSGYPLEFPTKMITLPSGARVAQYRKRISDELFQST